jgi:peptidyl-prolyl cis-trans isomerase SDCCAG10
MEGYYENTLFHRVIKDFIVQGGDPTGTGQGGESIYGEPFKDEFHSRLRFNRRGLIAMASSQVDDNGSQFFFTLGECPELNRKNTIFGKVAGNTIYNMIKLNECECINERPVRAEKVISTEVVFNPFDDIKPRSLKATTSAQPKAETKETEKKKIKLVVSTT